MASTVAPSQYKQSSRKSKTAWRKNVDITELQAGLEAAREEEIQGGVISEKPSNELFILDRTGSEEIRKKNTKQLKPLKADEIIAARASAIPGIDSRKRKLLSQDNATVKRQKKNTYVSNAEIQRLKSVAAGQVPESVSIEAGADHDPWEIVVKEHDPRFSFLDEKQPIRLPSTTTRKPIPLTSSGRAVASVKTPDPGKSYNPLFDDWNNLVSRTGEKEVKAERRRLLEAKEEALREAKALAEAARVEATVDAEYESAWDSEWEGIKSEAEEQSHLSKKRPERKTPTERKKLEKRKVQERLAKHEKAMKSREEQQARIRSIAKEVKQIEAARALQRTVMAEYSSDDSADDEDLRRVGKRKTRILDAPLELILADELSENLRTLRPQGNLLGERFRNLLVNGKIETRKAVTQSKKPRRERLEKWSYKDWKLR